MFQNKITTERLFLYKYGKKQKIYADFEITGEGRNLISEKHWKATKLAFKSAAKLLSVKESDISNINLFITKVGSSYYEAHAEAWNADMTKLIGKVSVHCQSVIDIIRMTIKSNDINSVLVGRLIESGSTLKSEFSSAGQVIQ